MSVVQRRRRLKMVSLETDAQQDIIAHKAALHLSTAQMAHTLTLQVHKVLNLNILSAFTALSSRSAMLF